MSRYPVLFRLVQCRVWYALEKFTAIVFVVKGWLLCTSSRNIRVFAEAVRESLQPQPDTLPNHDYLPR
jgi:hypothetical protein